MQLNEVISLVAFVGYSVTYSFGTPGRRGEKGWSLTPFKIGAWEITPQRMEATRIFGGFRVSMLFFASFSREEVYIYIYIYIYIFFFSGFLGVQFLGDDDPFLLGFGKVCYGAVFFHDSAGEESFFLL